MSELANVRRKRRWRRPRYGSLLFAKAEWQVSTRMGAFVPIRRVYVTRKTES